MALKYAWSFKVDSENYNGWYDSVEECLKNIRYSSRNNEKFVYIGETENSDEELNEKKLYSLEEIKKYDINTGQMLEYME